MVATPERKTNRSAEEIVRDLEAKIASVRARDARRKAKARPEVQLAILARRALKKAREAAEDAALKTALTSAHETVASALDAAVATTSTPIAAEPLARKRRGHSAEVSS